MFGKPKDLDRVVHSRAHDRARWAIRDHGDGAEDFVKRKLARPGLAAADRVLHRLTLRAIRELRRQETYGVVAVQPPRLVRFFFGLFGGRRRRRRRTR